MFFLVYLDDSKVSGSKVRVIDQAEIHIKILHYFATGSQFLKVVALSYSPFYFLMLM